MVEVDIKRKIRNYLAIKNLGVFKIQDKKNDKPTR